MRLKFASQVDFRNVYRMTLKNLHESDQSIMQSTPE